VKALPRRAQLYILFTALVAVLGIIGFLPSLLEQPAQWPVVLLFAGLICLSDLFPIVMPFPGDAEMTVSGALQAAAAILFGPAVVVWATFLGTLVAESTLRRVWYKALFNVAQMVITFGAMGILYQRFSDGTQDPMHSLRNVLALAAIALFYYLFNTGIVATVIAFANRVAISYVWKVSYRDVAWTELTMVPLGAMIVILWQSTPWAVLLMLLPLLVVRTSLLQSSVLQLQTIETLLALADTIDQRDPTTYQHSQRVAHFAEMIAKELGLAQDQVELISMSARLHDVGKIGMSNALLYKPQQFSLDEWQEFRRHPIIGANMVENFPLFRKGRALILHHHERWDGQGYPNRLAGEEIPIGARVICVADALEAMTSDRVYRKALTLDEAVEEFHRERGRQFDPKAVEALLVVVDSQRQQQPDWEQQMFARRIRVYATMQLASERVGT
jgi:putative nucleotidyltransferase with HDIG domain